jgi:5-formyltetrahydrofolate cyclo-ligase
MSITKPELRRQLLLNRSRIPTETRTAYSSTIIERVVTATEWRSVGQVHCYVPMMARSEVNTWPLIRYLWHQWPNITISVPGPLRAGYPTRYVIDVNTVWRKTGALPYPVHETLIEGGVFDIIIVPCLGFDSERYRLGYGSGYYDRLLQMQPSAKTIGLAFSAGYIPGGLPYEQHDIAVQHIITESIVL